MEQAEADTLYRVAGACCHIELAKTQVDVARNSKQAKEYFSFCFFFCPGMFALIRSYKVFEQSRFLLQC